MKKIFTLLVVLVATTSLWAQTFQVGDLCYNITSNTKPYTVEVTSQSGVNNYLGLKSINIPELVTYKGITYSITGIGSSAFYNCSSLTSVIIPNTVTKLGNNAFLSCPSLTSVTIGDGVKNIGYANFADCYALKSVIIGNSVTSIEQYAFDNCTSLTSITIPNSVKTIVKSAFMRCSSLTSITIGNSVTSIGDYAFDDCSSLTSITIPNSVTSIGSCAFLNCTSLTSVTIGNSVRSIGDFAFKNCTSITSFTWNAKNCADFDAVNSAPVYDSRSKVTSVTFGNEVERIPALLCYELTNLAFIICKATTPPTIDKSSTFYQVSTSIPVYVPCGCIDTYKAAEYWKKFTNLQEPLAEYSIEISTSNNQMGSAKLDYNTFCEGNQISAMANYGYHFVQWSDGVTDNPRSLTLTQDTILTAEFAIKTYNVTVEAENGAISGGGIYNHGTTITLTATPNEGYHFVKWSDGSTDNPRTIVVTEDINLTAEMIINTYNVKVNAKNGIVTGTGSYQHGETITITATPNDGYHFVKWSDGSTDNPRTIVVTEDLDLTAEIIINTYNVKVNAKNGIVTGTGSYQHGQTISITATPNEGYHFVKWSDGSTDNPRTIVATEDLDLTAEIIINTYNVKVKANNCIVTGTGSYQHGETISLTATPNEGYHFVKWSDGSTDNPRTIVVMKNISLTAQCIINTYDVTITAENGVISGTGTYNHGTTVRLAAIPNIGYHFVRWSDGNTDNPRSLVLTQDTTLTAEFAINTYTLTTKSNGNGNVTGNGTYKHGENVIISATADIGYQFIRWSDGNTDNPRTVVLTQDAAFSAEFAQSFSGQCGDNLYWAYNESDQSIAITGTGDMYNYTSGTQPWILFLEKIKKATTDNTAASLGMSAFEGAIRLAEVHIGAKIDMIEANVFAGCERLRNIYCYPTYPPIIRESSFARYDALLYIPCDYLDDYVFDRNWKKFENIQCAGAEKEEIESDDVDVDPSSTSVTMTWPTEENANTYTIEIMKGGALFCRLVFNTTGQLLNISFAPSRDGNNRPVQYAEQVANGSGLRFTITGLNESTHYTYDLRAKDKDENTIQSHSGEFTTKSNVTTDMDNISSPVNTCQKFFRNGQLIILRDGMEYNAQGQIIKE